jgi:hypothetical protein
VNHVTSPLFQLICLGGSFLKVSLATRKMYLLGCSICDALMSKVSAVESSYLFDFVDCEHLISRSVHLLYGRQLKSSLT